MRVACCLLRVVLLRAACCVLHAAFVCCVLHRKSILDHQNKHYPPHPPSKHVQHNYYLENLIWIGLKSKLCNYGYVTYFEGKVQPE